MIFYLRLRIAGREASSWLSGHGPQGIIRYGVYTHTYAYNMITRAFPKKKIVQCFIKILQGNRCFGKPRMRFEYKLQFKFNLQIPKHFLEKTFQYWHGLSSLIYIHLFFVWWRQFLIHLMFLCWFFSLSHKCYLCCHYPWLLFSFISPTFLIIE